jgi:hypothetical protein
MLETIFIHLTKEGIYDIVPGKSRMALEHLKKIIEIIKNQMQN